MDTKPTHTVLVDANNDGQISTGDYNVSSENLEGRGAGLGRIGVDHASCTVSPDQLA